MWTYYFVITTLLFSIATATAIVRTVFFSIMIYNRKPEIKIYDKRLYLRLFTEKDLLTEKGIYWRDKSVSYSIIFIIAALSFISAFVFKFS